MFYEDHPPPHIHARYNEFKARFDIATGAVISGNLPRQATRMVQEWIALRKDALAENWARTERGEQIERIEGLS